MCQDTICIDLLTVLYSFKIIFQPREDKSIPKDQPMSFQLEISKISVTNTRSISGVSSRSNLSKVVNACQMKSLFLSDEFPSKVSDYCAVTEKFINHVQGRSLMCELFALMSVELNSK